MEKFQTIHLSETRNFAERKEKIDFIHEYVGSTKKSDVLFYIFIYKKETCTGITVSMLWDNNSKSLYDQKNYLIDLVYNFVKKNVDL